MKSVDPSACFLSTADLSRKIGLCHRTIRQLAMHVDNPLPAYRIGGKLLFRWSDVHAWIERHRVQSSVDIETVAEEVLKTPLGEQRKRESSESNPEGN